MKGLFRVPVMAECSFPDCNFRILQTNEVSEQKPTTSLSGDLQNPKKAQGCLSAPYASLPEIQLLHVLSPQAAKSRNAA